MRIGVQFPHAAIVRDTHAVRDFAQAAEGLGYSHLVLYEHVIGAELADRNPPLSVGYYDETSEFHEPLIFFSFVAAVTSMIEFATSVVVGPQRQTALLAKQTAELAILSENRFRLGLGVGWNHVEFEALNEDFASRGQRANEQIEVLRMLWSAPVVDFHGRFHTISRAAIAPRPTKPVPLWVGGFSEPAYRRAAKLGDGFIYSNPTTNGFDPDPKGTFQHVRDLVAAEGRDPAAFGLELLSPVPASPGDFAALVADWEDSNIDFLTLHLQGGSLQEPAEYIAALETYMKAIS